MSVENPLSEVFVDLQAAVDHLRACRNRLEKMSKPRRLSYLHDRVDLWIDEMLAEVPVGQDISCLESLARRVDSGETKDYVYS